MKTHLPVYAAISLDSQHRFRTRPRQVWLYVPVLVLLGLLAACGSDQKPIVVYVTPTPAAIADSDPADFTGQDLSQALPATPTPTTPPGVSFGPIVGPNHTLVPTETRVPPTEVPTVIPTAGPSPTPRQVCAAI